MEVKSVVNRETESTPGQAEWISGAEALRILDWDNINSVRNRARLGGFRWRRKGNGRLEFFRADVQEYADRIAAAGAAAEQAVAA